MPDQSENSQGEVAQRIAASTDDVERAKLLAWVSQLVQIRDGSDSLFAKGTKGVATSVSVAASSKLRRRRELRAEKRGATGGNFGPTKQKSESCDSLFAFSGSTAGYCPPFSSSIFWQSSLSGIRCHSGHLIPESTR